MIGEISLYKSLGGEARKGLVGRQIGFFGWGKVKKKVGYEGGEDLNGDKKVIDTWG